MDGNPVSSHRLYRHFVLYHAKQLTHLDLRPVTGDDIRVAEETAREEDFSSLLVMVHGEFRTQSVFAG